MSTRCFLPLSDCESVPQVLEISTSHVSVLTGGFRQYSRDLVMEMEMVVDADLRRYAVSCHWLC